MRGYHFATTTLRDGRPLPAAGVLLEHAGPVEPCESGLHASVRAIDALRYAPGPWVAIVEIPDDAIPHGSPVDKHAGAWRTALCDYVDASEVLHRLACKWATEALDREEAEGRAVDPRSRAAVAAKLAWLDGTLDDAGLLAAESAARSAAVWSAAAWSAVWSAVDSAAWSAAWSAADSAAWSAADSAAWSAARSAARSAVWSAVWSAMNTDIEAALADLFRGAAR